MLHVYAGIYKPIRISVARLSIPCDPGAGRAHWDRCVLRYVVDGVLQSGRSGGGMHQHVTGGGGVVASNVASSAVIAMGNRAGERTARKCITICTVVHRLEPPDGLCPLLAPLLTGS